MINQTKTIAISVVIPSYKSSHTIELCLKSVLSQNTKIKYEVILIDSTPNESVADIANKYKKITFIRSKKRLYAGQARNKGIKIAKGKIIAFTDADCIVASDWIQNTWLSFKKNSDYMAIGGAICLDENANDIEFVEYMGTFSELMPSMPFGNIRSGCPTANVAYRREVFEKVGMFPETDFLSEERIFNEWVIKKYSSFLFDNAIKVVHQHRDNLMIFLRRQYINGIGFALSRETYGLPGKYLCRYLFFLLPFASIYKKMKRVYLYSRKDLPRFARNLHIALLGAFVFAAGHVSFYFLKLNGNNRSGK